MADKIIEFLALLRFNLIHELADLVLQALAEQIEQWRVAIVRMVRIPELLKNYQELPSKGRFK